jgi:hypothetical protein
MVATIDIVNARTCSLVKCTWRRASGDDRHREVHMAAGFYGLFFYFVLRFSRIW